MAHQGETLLLLRKDQGDTLGAFLRNSYPQSDAAVTAQRVEGCLALVYNGVEIIGENQM